MTTQNGEGKRLTSQKITTANRAKNINSVYRKSHANYFITYEKMFNHYL